MIVRNPRRAQAAAAFLLASLLAGSRGDEVDDKVMQDSSKKEEEAEANSATVDKEEHSTEDKERSAGGRSLASSSCRLYWAPSTIPEAGNGCFTAVDFAGDTYLPSLDTIVPAFEACPFVDLDELLEIFPSKENEEVEDEDEDDYDYIYSHITQMIKECYPPGDNTNAWAWFDYSWNAHSLDSGRWTKLVTEVDIHSMGIGALCNANPGSNNVNVEQDMVEGEGEEDGARAGRGAGAFSSDGGSMRYYTTFPVTAGSELFLNYGLSYYEDRGYGGNDDINVSENRSLEYLEKHGKCLDNVLPGPSHIGRHAGQGAIASRSMQRGSVIAPLPIIYIIDGEEVSEFDMYDVKVDVSGEEGEHQIHTLRTVPMGKQIMLNYMLGHAESSLLLSPYGPFHYNHDSNPNAQLQWARDGLGHRAELLNMSVEELGAARGRKTGLVLDVIALRDIGKHEEVTIDYGREWADAWEDHTKNWHERKGMVSTAKADEEREALFHPHAFRHKIMMSDDIYPESWRNLKRNIFARARDDL